ncbi:type II toxin-antitoxin system RelE/ParE family toxin [Flavipsychrobacter stenotrophus]|uniref:type II toxin-antitoxin system RelE/ParE family toxin n=1 Tax=Flavipsychrobacter stenotrophus TaxID=2077091 RepID=UPI000E435105
MATSKILWATRARKQYVKILDYIRSDSLQNAIAFDNDLKEKLNRISRFPEMCPIDQ